MANKSLEVGGLADISDTKRFELIHKTIIAGTAFRLDGSTTKIDQYIWDGWLSGFTATMHKEEYDQCEKFAILWSQDDVAESPELGIPSNIDELVYLVKNYKIDRKSVPMTGDSSVVTDGHPSGEVWAKILQLKSADWRLVKQDSLEPTDVNIRQVVDVIIRYISGGYYEQATDSSAPYGTETNHYFQKAADIRAAMRKYRYLATRLLPVDMVDPFLDGYYRTHSVLIETLKRRYGLGKDQLLMTDHFKKLSKIIKEDIPMEFKIGKLQSQINRLLIKKPEDFPSCQDFPGHVTVQRYPEECGPIVHTLLQFIVFQNTVDEGDWERIEKEYHHKISGAPSYRKWHENRYELYKILDTEKKLKLPKRLANINESDDDGYDGNNEASEAEVCAVQKRYLGPQRRKQQQQQQTKQRNNRYSNNNNKSAPNRQGAITRDRLKDLFCRNCSKFAGKPKYHYGPYGGTSNSKCGFTKTGNKRSKDDGFKGFIRSLFGENVEDYDEEMVQLIDIVWEEPSGDEAVYEDMCQVKPDESEPFYPF